VTATGAIGYLFHDIHANRSSPGQRWGEGGASVPEIANRALDLSVSEKQLNRS
jgi:hypothetical protein